METPESIDLQAEPAGLVVRGLAFAIDFLIRAVVLLVLGFFLFFSGAAGAGLLLILWFLLEWFYPVLFEIYGRGQTPGKRRMGIAVVNEDLTPIGWGTSMIRNLLRWADFFPFLYTAGMVSMAASARFQRLGDLAAGTLVIYQEAPPEGTHAVEAPSRPPPVPLEREDQIAVIGYAQRQLSPDRRRELADILAPVLPVEAGQRVGYLQGVGRWLLGDR